MQKLVAGMPIDSLLLETDSPALAPAKEEENHPANVIVSCREVARIKDLSEDQVAAITTQNAKKLFTRL